MPNGSSTSPSGNFDTSWDSLLPSNNNNSASVRDRPDFSFSFSPLASSPHNNHHRTSQHRRRNHRSPVNPQNSNSLSSNQPNRTNHEPLPPLSLDSYNPQLPDTAAFEQYPQSQPGQQSRTDQHIQLPGINTTFPDFNFNDRPTSRFSWDSTGGDSLFADGDFWPDFDDSNINYSLDNDGFVDLTADPSPLHAMGPVTRKRRASATPLPAPSSLPSCSAKRRKTNEGAAVKIEEAKVEQLDLLDVDDDSGLSQVLEQQQVAAIKEQQEPQGDQPIRLSSLQCIICLEPMKDMTVTHCGES